jgi:hypothetical protein
MVEAPSRPTGSCNPHTEDGSLRKLQTYTRLPDCPIGRFSINKAPQRVLCEDFTSSASTTSSIPPGELVRPQAARKLQ